jgi:hypothetical protein
MPNNQGATEGEGSISFKRRDDELKPGEKPR